MTESVTVIHSAGTLANIAASVIEPDTELSRDGIRSRSDKTLFVIKTSLLSTINIQRGVKISRAGDTYEVVHDRGRPWYYNDPNNLDIVISTKLLCS